MTKTSTTADATETDPSADPARVEGAPGSDVLNETIDLGDDDDGRPSNEQIEATIVALAKLDVKAQEAGHSLADVIATAAKNAYGIDLR